MLCLITHSSAFGTRVQERFKTESLRSGCRRRAPIGVPVIEVLTASSSTSPNSCRFCWAAKRFKLPFSFGRQDKVALRQTLNLVGPDLHLALPPAQRQVRMMALSLRDSANLVRKCQRLREVREGVAPLQMPFSVELPALAEFLQQRLRAKNLQRGHTNSIATFLVSQFHRNLPSVVLDGAFTY